MEHDIFSRPHSSRGKTVYYLFNSLYIIGCAVLFFWMGQFSWFNYPEVFLGVPILFAFWIAGSLFIVRHWT